MRVGFKDYLWAAFNARPWGMLIPLNWLGLAAAGLLGYFVEPGFWLIGAGVELAYLLALACNPRFQKVVESRSAGDVQLDWQKQIDQVVATLPQADRAKYQYLQERCRTILSELSRLGTEGLSTIKEESFGKLLLVYLRLLTTRALLKQVLAQTRSTNPHPPRQGQNEREMLESDSIDLTMAELQKKLQDQALDEALRGSLEGQLDILRQRQEKQREARKKLKYIEAELARVEQQVELVRELGLVPSGGEDLSARIDGIAQNLGQTAQWISQQQELYGQVDPLVEEGGQAALAAGRRGVTN